MHTRRGKIARLPHILREEVNRRLLDGQTSPVVLAWLNAQPEAVKVWEAHFEGAEATAQNVSEWRGGGYKEWIATREKAEHLKTLSTHAAELAKAGGNKLSAAAQSILAGHILETLETAIHADEGDEAPDDPVGRLQKLSQAITGLRHADIAADRLDLDKRKAGQKDRQLTLDQKKFEMQTAAKFLEWARSPEAIAILDSGKPKHIQMDALRALMFGAPKAPAKEGA